MRSVVGNCSDRRVHRACGLTDVPMITVWFASWRQLDGGLSDENGPLLRLMQDKQLRTVLQLAELSGRAARSPSRTLRNLEGYGLVELLRSPNAPAVHP